MTMVLLVTLSVKVKEENDNLSLLCLGLKVVVVFFVERDSVRRIYLLTIEIWNYFSIFGIMFLFVYSSQLFSFFTRLIYNHYFFDRSVSQSDARQAEGPAYSGR